MPKTKTKGKAPTVEYILSLMKWLEDNYKEDDTLIDEVRQVRERKKPVNLPKKYKLVDIEIRDSSIAEEVQRIAASLYINPPDLHVTPASIGDEAQINSTKREKFHKALLLFMSTTDREGSTLKQNQDKL